MLLEPPHAQVGFSDALQSQICNDLETQGWSQQDFSLPDELIITLAAECRQMSVDGTLKSAGIGRAEGQVLRQDIRGDQIAWLKAGQSIACDRYLQIMESVRQMLNRTLYLGLEEYESHFAMYSPGAYYLKHLDRFRDDDCRIVSAVIYLNPDWQPEQGGALRLHLDENHMEDITPLGGRLVLFMSADMPHEVLPATHDRISLAGWFRRRV
ncbi:2OG-Fe(II) oxygenase [Herminiimonas sp. NPDC097707]|uniref:2OG-Fe(II) oxygenase n=1 Tax=Herminiimonas sp. NPDC097707 TaxID=3364007 RepID=UPI00383A3E4C